MFWMIVWMVVLVIAGLALTRYNWTDTKQLLLGNYELMDTFESVFGLFWGIGLIGSPIWLAIGVYPEGLWYHAPLVALAFGAAGTWLIIILNILKWMIIGLVFAVMYPFTKSKRERIKAQRRLQYQYDD